MDTAQIITDIDGAKWAVLRKETRSYVAQGFICKPVRRDGTVDRKSPDVVVPAALVR